jgi:hypothetical protein
VASSWVNVTFLPLCARNIKGLNGTITTMTQDTLVHFDIVILTDNQLNHSVWYVSLTFIFQ